MKLQKLVYYSQAWSLVWDDRALFHEPIQAWANGPVVRELYARHRGQFDVREWPYGDATVLDEKARETIDAVLGYYAPRSAQWLSDLTHRESPWRQARQGVPDGERSDRVISLESMMEYYSTLPADEDRD
ncbi:MAG TPA: type II toxin-antitoxin system antitoxin SocA domain-containing protein [Longimicrobium sp.]|uniref:Panacea domain-containing protein n=1 Tax=Longimicrobium sp. TaxID=2029185 RepID=UPI002ED92233